MIFATVKDNEAFLVCQCVCARLPLISHRSFTRGTNSEPLLCGSH